MKIAVAMSGGVDSLFTLLSLHRKGHQVMALHARLLPASSPLASDPVPGLKAICAELDIPLHVVDLRKEFQHSVVEVFIEEHRLARTPNPCAWCNRNIKIGKLLDLARELGAERMATGHYADLSAHPVYGNCLRAAADKKKDQSYFLSLVPRERLEACCFPLAGLHKTDILEELASMGISPPLPGESQEICFVPRDDHRDFLKRHGLREKSGPIVETGGSIVGTHHGLWQYTEGQRKGLGISWSEPLFVLRRDREANRLLVGPAAALHTQECTASRLNILAPGEQWPQKLLVRTRYRQAPAPAQVEIQHDQIRIRFEQPQTPPAPGQVAAVYDQDGFVLAGGILDLPAAN